MKRYQKKWQLLPDAVSAKVQRRDIISYTKADGTNVIRFAGARNHGIIPGSGRPSQWGGFIYDYKWTVNPPADVLTWDHNGITLLGNFPGITAWDIGRCTAIAFTLMTGIEAAGSVQRRQPQIRYDLVQRHTWRSFAANKSTVLARQDLLSEAFFATEANAFAMNFQTNGFIEAWDQHSHAVKRTIFRQTSCTIVFNDGSELFGRHAWSSVGGIHPDIGFHNGIRWRTYMSRGTSYKPINWELARSYVRGLGAKQRRQQGKMFASVIERKPA